ncbi:bifunctional folylpolyglutamate synthase/dihydrofolate synthase [Acidobacteria bacterium AH-259-L09]|nr:bifunctional folylpolyglutamate synthase/dihydrofolate synthase [Acidobacteria bacterium AH-259-L09]
MTHNSKVTTRNMNYSECLAYLQKLGDEVLTMKFGLETMRTLLGALGNPHLKYPSLLIAGTNGKGSVARLLNSIFTACGIRNALYTSPHLIKVEERFVLDNRPIESETFAHYFARVVDTISRLKFSSHPTYFETLTALAFLYFSEQKVEIAILEVGMGGRLDSTNVVDPVLSILTSVGLDHQRFLGGTLEEIAREKAGILHEARPALMAPQRAQVRQVFLSEAAKKKVTLHELDSSSIEYLGSREGKYAFRFHGSEFKLQLYGQHQVESAALAVQAVEILRNHGFAVSATCTQKGVERTQWIGRIQVLGQDPTVVLDGAHNLDAAKKLVNFLTLHTRPPRTLVFGMMRDKDVGAVLEILRPYFDRIYLTCINSPRAATIDELKSLLPSGVCVDDPFAAYCQALSSSATTVVAGSLYLVGEILERGRRAGSSAELALEASQPADKKG